MSDTATNPVFTISRVFKAPRARVWQAWTDPAQFSRWFGPKGVVTTVLAFDLRPGGIVHACMETPDGVRMWARFLYREVTPTTRLVWQHAFANDKGEVIRAPFFDGNWPLELLSTAVLADEGDGTRVTITWTPIDATEVERQTFIGNMESMTQGWSGTFDQLEALLAG